MDPDSSIPWSPGAYPDPDPPSRRASRTTSKAQATSSASAAAPQSGGGGRKKGTACARCRAQKIRCDDERPSCSNCAKTNHTCVRTNLLTNNQSTASYITQIETRLRSLEDSLRRTAPAELDNAPTITLERLQVPPSIDWTSSAEDQNPTAAISEHWEEDHPGQQQQEEQQPLDHGLLIGSSPQNAEPARISSDNGHQHIHQPVHDMCEVGAGQSQEDPSPNAGSSSHPRSDLSPSAATEISPSEPLAHEVGMLSLASSKESKYIGPSSGVPFARLISSAIPQSRGSMNDWTAAGGGEASLHRTQQIHPFPSDWTTEVDLQHFVDAYFETYQPLFPFLDEDTVADNLERLYTRRGTSTQSLQMPSLSEVDASLSPFHSAQLFLIIALGARILETRLSVEFSSERYLATAMQRISSLALREDMEGLQIMLLLALTSFYFEDGPNAWFLVTTTISSCLDLGLQRRNLQPHATMFASSSSPPSLAERRNVQLRNHLRRGIFWSAYSLERTLCVVLGRPLTLRDEAIDIEFPGDEHNPGGPTSPSGPDRSNEDTLLSAEDTPEGSYPTSKRPRVNTSPYAAAQFSFRFDQITAEIKLMLYRVVNLPTRFPWPTDLDSWQLQVHQHCDSLLARLQTDVRRGLRHRRSSDTAIHSLELKYHSCLMLLCRPSPAIPRPSSRSWNTCYDSAVATVLISSDLHRFSKLANSWLTAHTIFVSGITFLYCLWNQPDIKQRSSLAEFSSNAAACTVLLKYLARTWSVAADAVVKFERLVHLTANSWRAAADVQQRSEIAAGQSLLSMSQAQSQDRDGLGLAEGQEQGVGDVNEPTNTTTLPGFTHTVGPSGMMHDFQQNGGEIGAESFFSELGDLSTWFDLNWLVDANVSHEVDMPQLPP